MEGLRSRQACRSGQGAKGTGHSLSIQNSSAGFRKPTGRCSALVLMVRLFLIMQTCPARSLFPKFSRACHLPSHLRAGSPAEKSHSTGLLAESAIERGQLVSGEGFHVE